MGLSLYETMSYRPKHRQMCLLPLQRRRTVSLNILLRQIARLEYTPYPPFSPRRCIEVQEVVANMKGLACDSLDAAIGIIASLSSEPAGFLNLEDR